MRVPNSPFNARKSSRQPRSYLLIASLATLALVVVLASGDYFLGALSKSTKRNTLNKLSQAHNDDIPVPIFNGNGVVIFYHIPKTGGTTVRSAFMQGEVYDYCTRRSYDTHNFVRPCNGEWDKTIVPRIDNIMRGGRQELLVVEIHDAGFGIGTHHENIQQWKQLSIENNVPFFAFTYVREPISWYVSHFLFYHNKGCTDDWCHKDTYEDLNEANLIKSAMPDDQTDWLVCNHDCGYKKSDITFLGTDWDVFTTDSLSYTAPILVKNILGQELPETKNVNHNKKLIKTSGLTAESLSKKTRATLEAISKRDHRIYKAAQERMRKWKQFTIS